MSASCPALTYNQELEQGLRLAGEAPEWFAKRRIDIIREHVSSRGQTVHRVMEFGCGTGNHIPFSRLAFRDAEIVGVDISRPSLAIANSKYASTNIRFCTPEEFEQTEAIDLIYVSGVFHHIPAEQHATWLRYLHRVLKPQGTLIIFDNNPFSLPARMVMKRIPFDHDAVMVSPYHFSTSLTQCGFVPAKRRFYFIFPRMLNFLRPLESVLNRWPVGAQYGLFATKQ